MTIAIHAVDLFAHVAAHAGVPSELAGTAVTELLAGLAPLLDPAGVELVASELPVELAPAIHHVGPPLPIEDRMLAAGIPRGLVRELLASVARVLGEELSTEALVAVRAVVSPELAGDTERTQSEAERLWKRVDRENLMVKVPATPAGIPAVRHLIGQGINVNITLLFSQETYEEVA
ncbi:MAG: transaldolase family protein, partial [Kofleriaceae bacterium]